MRIFHVIATDQARGAEVFASELFEALRPAGVDQKVVVLRRANGKLSQHRTDIEIVRPTSRTRIPGLRVNPRGLARLRQAIREWGPDVVQAHGGEALKYSVLARLRRAHPIVYRRIGCAPQQIRAGVRRRAHSQLMRRATRIIAVAEAVRRETVDIFRIPSQRCVVIPNGVNKARLESNGSSASIRREFRIPERAPLVMSVGALSWEKDPLGLVEIFDGARRRIPAAHLVMVGDGPLRKEVDEEISNRGLGGCAVVTGVRRDIGALLEAGDVFLFASRNDGMEGMPATIIEAGMKGLPVAAYSVAGVAEVVQDGVTGVLASPGDQQGLRDEVVKILREPQLRTAMGAAARERCTQRYSIESVAEQYLSVYEELTR